MVADKGGAWNDDACTKNKHYVCSKPSTPCMSDDWTYEAATGRCYRYYGDQTYENAQAQCAAGGARLAHAASEAEDNILRNMITGNGIWLGMTDKVKEGKWILSDGTEMGYTNWNDGEPNNAGGEHCVEMKDNGKWNDIPCTDRSYPFACYKEIGAVTRRGAVQVEGTKSNRRSGMLVDRLIERLLEDLQESK